jgi:hypothetical protein
MVELPLTPNESNSLLISKNDMLARHMQSLQSNSLDVSSNHHMENFYNVNSSGPANGSAEYGNRYGPDFDIFHSTGDAGQRQTRNTGNK